MSLTDPTMIYDQLCAFLLVVVCPFTDILDAHLSPSECSSAPFASPTPNQQSWNRGSFFNRAVYKPPHKPRQLHLNIYSKTFKAKLFSAARCGWRKLQIMCGVLFWFVAPPIQHSWVYRSDLLTVIDRTAASCVRSGKNCPETLNCLSARASRTWTECSKHTIHITVSPVAYFRNKKKSRRWNIFH